MRVSTRLVSVLLFVACLFMSVPAQAITSGEPDGDAHPYVGLLVFQTGNTLLLCSGALVAPRVFLTAGHCTSGATRAWVSFAPAYQPGTFPGAFVTGQPHAHPLYNEVNRNTYDIGVVILDSPVYLSRYAQLPQAQLLDSYATQRGLHDLFFTIVGYGTRSVKPFVEEGLVRYHAPTDLITLSSALASGAHLQITGNPGNGRGGTCSGDSGGPALLEDSDTVTGVASFVLNQNCMGTSFYYRVDTQESLAFVNSYLAQVPANITG